MYPNSNRDSDWLDRIPIGIPIGYHESQPETAAFLSEFFSATLRIVAWDICLHVGDLSSHCGLLYFEQTLRRDARLVFKCFTAYIGRFI